MGLHKLLIALSLAAVLAPAQSKVAMPKWCGELPRPQYATLERVHVNDTWFEVYKVAPAVFAIYEPHQAEEVISYLVVGDKRALLFDTGMGVGDIKKLTVELVRLPVVVLNSHTHNDHVGDNWRFAAVWGMDTGFTRRNAQGSRADAQSELADGQICGQLPKGFDLAAYVTKPWKIKAYTHDADRIDLGGRTLQVIATPGHTPDSISLFDAANGLVFTGDTYNSGDGGVTETRVRLATPAAA
jgi:glyoxylase-like metal-dependent hydrolase (beta-lactamase superfamily II)